MAAYRRLESGLWQAQIFRRGVRRSASFANKGAAVAWAGRVEAEVMAGVRGEIPNLTVRELLERYERDVSVGKKGARWEVVRLQAVGRDPLASVKLRQLDTPDVSAWQQRRLKAVSGASVRRERNLLNNVFNLAVNEWRWLVKNPFQGIRRPRDGKPRRRIASPAEIAKLMKAASPGMRQAIGIALETGMRAGEIPRAEVNGRVAFLADTKNNEVREVPLSAKAVEYFGDGVTLTAGSISALFARLTDECGIEGLTFHDLRATAATRLCKVLNPLQLAKMFGWKDLKQAMVYYRETAADVAKLL
jgi:integrase